MEKRLGGRRWVVQAIAAAVIVAAGVAFFALVRGGRHTPAAKQRDTLAAEAKAGDFADYWVAVLKLSRRHAAQPDSFRLALDALPGSHLTDAEWNAWVAPYRADPVRLAAKIERAMAEMSLTPLPGGRPGMARASGAFPLPPPAKTPASLPGSATPSGPAFPPRSTAPRSPTPSGAATPSGSATPSGAATRARPR